jgi:hypothetical protein
MYDCSLLIGALRRKMSMCSPDHNLRTPYKSSEKKKRKSLSFSLMSKYGKCHAIQIVNNPLALQPTFGPWPTSMKLSVSLQFTRSWTFGRTPWTGDQLVARPLPVRKHRKTHIHKH